METEINVYATRPWAYPMRPPGGKKAGRPNRSATPENIDRCLACTYPDCKYESERACREKQNEA